MKNRHAAVKPAVLAFLACALSLGSAQTNYPPVPVPARAIFTNDSVKLFRDISKLPGSPASIPSSPAPATNFLAMEGGYWTPPTQNPPDTHGAVGKNLIMAMHNQGIQFSASLVLSSASGCTNSSNLRAMSESGEPAHGGYTNTASVWFRWTAPTNGQVVFSITNTAYYARNFDSMLAVYTGQSLTNLTAITNHHGGVERSQVVFCTVADTTYDIAVAGVNRTMGDFTLSWLQSALPYFCVHPQSSNVVAGESVTFESLATGNPVPTYQWLSNGVAILNATNADYTISGVQQTAETNQFFYSSVATNTYGSATSQVALLVVHDAATAKIANCR
jgi:hypothetical protein